MPLHRAPEWTTGWPAHRALELPDRLIANDASTWVTWPGTGLQGRDLMLSELTAGLLSGQHVRATGTDAGQGEWHCYDADFEFVYLLAGSLVLETSDGATHNLGPGSSFYHPGFFWHRDLHRSGDLEVVRLTSPAVENRFDRLSARLPSRSAMFPATKIALYHDALEFGNEEPRLATTPLGRRCGTHVPTEGRIEMQVVQADGSSQGGSSFAPSGEWLYVLGGAAEVSTKKGQSARLIPGCSLSMATAHGGHPEFHSVTSDFIVLEMCTGLS